MRMVTVTAVPEGPGGSAGHSGPPAAGNSNPADLLPDQPAGR